MEINFPELKKDNLKLKDPKVLVENVCELLSDFRAEKNFLHKIQKLTIKDKTDKFGHIKINYLCSLKQMFNIMKTQVIN